MNESSRPRPGHFAAAVVLGAALQSLGSAHRPRSNTTPQTETTKNLEVINIFFVELKLNVVRR